MVGQSARHGRPVFGLCAAKMPGPFPTFRRFCPLPDLTVTVDSDGKSFSEFTIVLPG